MRLNRGKHIVIVCLMAAISMGAGAVEETLNRVRISGQDAKAISHILEESGFDILETTEAAVDLAVNSEEWELLMSMGYSPVFIEKGRPFYEIQQERGTVPTGYSDLTDIIAQMQATAAAFPAIARLVNLTELYGMEPTFEGRDLYAIKISDNVNVDEDEPSLLVVSAHHCREIVTPVLALHAIEQLTTLYGTDAAITEAVNSHEIWISPVWNPDGYNHVFTGDNLWRKNRTIFPTGIGVDTNRNYAFAWDSICGGSTSVSSSTYRGPSEASEAETQTMMAFSEDRYFTKILDYHSSGREALYAYSPSCNLHPFNSFQQSSAMALSTASGYFGDNRSPSANGEHYEWQLKQFSSFSFLIETHTTFQPSFASAQAEAQTTWPGVLWMLEQPTPLSGHVRSGLTGQPLSAVITLDPPTSPNGEQNRSRPLNGRYHLFVPPGQYDVVFSAEGYEPQTHMVTITSDAQILEVDLMPETLCRGDLTGDEMVTVLDIIRVVNALGQSGGPEDIDNNGTVTLEDVRLIASGWGGCLPDSSL